MSKRQNRCVAVTLLLLLGAGATEAQLLPQSGVIRSSSGQFVVQKAQVPPRPALDLTLATNALFINLEPALVAVSCERIKQRLLREFGDQDSWRSKVSVVLHPSGGLDDPAAVLPNRFPDGWQYRVELPNPIERTWYARTLVQAVLLEMANREAGPRPAEIPVWLNEGLAQRLLAAYETEIILTPPAQRSAGGAPLSSFIVIPKKDDPLGAVHDRLRAHSPLTFDELSWPAPDQFVGEKGQLYSDSAQLFVHELLALPKGNARLRTMLARLPQYLNWQFAFLDAFHDFFQRPRDIEKWWTLQVMHFTGHELSQALPVEETWQKLDDILHSAVQVQTGVNDLPLQARVNLQTIVRQWNPVQQTEAFTMKLRELEALKPTMTPELGPLVLEYQLVLSAFLQERDHPGFTPFGRDGALRRLMDVTAQHLDELDAHRQQLKPAKMPGPGPGPVPLQGPPVERGPLPPGLPSVPLPGTPR